MKAAGSNALLVVGSLLAAWVLTEALARLFLGPPRLPGDRVVLFSKPHWKHAPDGSLRYAPRSRVRTVAAWGNRVEYDVTFQTNNLGFIDWRHYEGSEDRDRHPTFAFVGDSLTAGVHGGAPWVPRLRDAALEKHPGLEIYNLGVGGVGLPQFYSLLKQVERQLDFDRIVVLFISDDLFRVPTRVIEADDLIYLCPRAMTRARCLAAESRMLVMRDRGMSHAEIFEAIRARGLAREPDTLGSWLRTNTYLGSLVGNTGEATDTFAENLEKLEGVSVEARFFQNFRSGFPQKEIVFVQIPQREETAHGRYYVDVSAAVRDAGIEYVSLLESCDIEDADYHEVDPHPNQSGYEKILRCVGRALDLL